MSEARSYNSTLRREQAEATRERILAAMAAILEEGGSAEATTNKVVAERAGVTEVTVYRHFSSREALLQAMWKWLNNRQGVRVGLPQAEVDIVGKLPALFASFDAAPAHIMASLITPQGREMRTSMNPERQEAFLTALADTGTLSDADRRKAAAVLQLLYSAYSWLSLREQWDLTGDDAADAVAWAAETLIEDMKTRGGAAIAPASSHRGKTPA
jgi:AcrR family transcriptional regulator